MTKSLRPRCTLKDGRNGEILDDTKGDHAILVLIDAFFCDKGVSEKDREESLDRNDIARIHTRGDNSGKVGPSNASFFEKFKKAIGFHHDEH